MVLLGDTAQLPPVNLDISPALDTQTLSLNYNKVEYIELDEVMRQEEDSEFCTMRPNCGIIEDSLSLIFSLTLKFKASFG
jgi:hypothetical protein